MSLAQVHLDIAKERFLELMADDPNRSVTQAVDDATHHANTFVGLYQPLVAENALLQAKKTKGCKACFGSGGKIGAPCGICAGTGRVPA